jgi:hypothetical protein
MDQARSVDRLGSRASRVSLWEHFVVHGWEATAAKVFGKMALAVTAVLTHPAATRLTDAVTFTCEASSRGAQGAWHYRFQSSTRRNRGGIRGLQGTWPFWRQ